MSRTAAVLIRTTGMTLMSRWGACDPHIPTIPTLSHNSDRCSPGPRPCFTALSPAGALEDTVNREEGSRGVVGGAGGMSKEMMGGVRALENLRNPSIGPIGSALPSWKLYDNPFYYEHHHHGHHHHRHPNFSNQHPYNHAHLPLSARKLAASLWDLATIFHPMDTGAGGAATSELHIARARIRELKAELEFERRLRKKAEALSRALAREASEERARREAEERTREGLAAELARAREEVGELRRAVEEERRMMRVAEAMREERVQMKLAEARLLMEEKLLEMGSSSPATRLEEEAGEDLSRTKAIPAAADETSANSAAEDGGRSSGAAECEGGGGGGQCRQRKEAENPHIRRGIKGFVEFPKLGRARAGWSTGPRDAKGDPGPKLECQRAQLRVLLKHRVPVGLGSSREVNLVM